MPFLPTGTHRLHYEVAGCGPWLTLSHGLAGNLSQWDVQMTALTQHFTVLRYDLRGHGASTVAPAPFGFADLVADVVQLLDHLGVARTHFIGLSLGGMIGQHLALAAAERLERLILCSTTSGLGPAVVPVWQSRIAAARREGMESQVEGFLWRWFTEDFRVRHPDTVAAIADIIRATPVAGYTACAALIPTIDTTAQLGQVASPTLVLAGEVDVSTPPAMAEIMAKAIPGARQDVIPAAAHLLNIEQAAVFNQAVLAFLAGI